ncbi:hypothetical protein V7S43_016159 [Phytophthora oleae]|uniref:HAT C-terminal dimerisation domain-containing protein n=1 Tax=Phytophthora oleae TaxID=2107226 RepID=A0ABD3EWW4_9STRA
MFLSAVCGINDIVAERDSDNGPSDELPPVPPHQLIQMKIPAFNKLLQLHKPRLAIRLSPSEIHKIDQDFVQLKDKYRTDEGIRNSIDSANDESTSFECGWELLGAEFPWLQQFAGDLASTFPNTASVESDFSIMGWEKDEYRQSLTDFSLEGVLHAKQYNELQNLRREL